MIPPVFHEGDHWSFERAVRFVSAAANIEMQNDDRFELVAKREDREFFLEASRRQTGTHLSNGAFVPAPAKGEPYVFKMPISGDGTLTLADTPSPDLLEYTLNKILVAAWDGRPLPEDEKTIRVLPLGLDSERVIYDGSPNRDRARISGIVTFDPATHAPISISLVGENVYMPGGPERVSAKVEYRRRLTPHEN